jgi:hypothetical protein
VVQEPKNHSCRFRVDARKEKGGLQDALPFSKGLFWIYNIQMLEFQELRPSCKPKSYMSDFESACIKAFEEEFPSGKTSACWFHLCQSFRRVAAENGLQADLADDQDLEFDFKRLRDRFLHFENKIKIK